MEIKRTPLLLKIGVLITIAFNFSAGVVVALCTPSHIGLSLTFIFLAAIVLALLVTIRQAIRTSLPITPSLGAASPTVNSDSRFKRIWVRVIFYLIIALYFATQSIVRLLISKHPAGNMVMALLVGLVLFCAVYVALAGCLVRSQRHRSGAISTL